MSLSPGWYKDPADPTTQRWWDGEGWLGDPIPADAPAPEGPPTVKPDGPATVKPDGPPTAGPGRPATVTPDGPHVDDRMTPVPPGAPPAGPPPPPVSGPPPGYGPPPVYGPPPGHVAPPVPHPYPYQGPYQGPPPVGPGWAPPPGYPPGHMPYPIITAAAPAPAVHGEPVAGLGARLLARLIDIAALLGLNILVNGWFVYRWVVEIRPFFAEYLRRWQARESTADMVAPEQSNSLLIVVLLLITALWFAYEVPTLANTGQTLGKRLIGIKVMRLESRDQLGFGRAIRRWNLMGLATMLWTCFGIGFLIQFAVSLSPVLNWPLHQGLHDRSAGTVVVTVGKNDKTEGKTT